MNSARKPNAMLIELVIVILFFSISAGIILQLFVAAGSKSNQNSVDNETLLIAEDVAERFAASTLNVEDFFAQSGWTGAEGEGYTLETVANERPVRFHADTLSTINQAGALYTATLTAYDGERVVVTLPLARYKPLEVAP